MIIGAAVISWRSCRGHASVQCRSRWNVHHHIAHSQTTSHLCKERWINAWPHADTLQQQYAGTAQHYWGFQYLLQILWELGQLYGQCKAAWHSGKQCPLYQQLNHVPHAGRFLEIQQQAGNLPNIGWSMRWLRSLGILCNCQLTQTRPDGPRRGLIPNWCPTACGVLLDVQKPGLMQPAGMQAPPAASHAWSLPIWMMMRTTLAAEPCECVILHTAVREVGWVIARANFLTFCGLLLARWCTSTPSSTELPASKFCKHYVPALHTYIWSMQAIAAGGRSNKS